MGSAFYPRKNYNDIQGIKHLPIAYPLAICTSNHKNLYLKIKYPYGTRKKYFVTLYVQDWERQNLVQTIHSNVMMSGKNIDVAQVDSICYY